ncbi:MAG: hypothetical protein ACR2RV_26035, partial [Verrucomicrobiales bacterium]
DVLKVYFPPIPHPAAGSQEFSSPDFDTEIPICFSPSGRILVTAKPTGSIFFWKLDLVRTRLEKDWELDWNLRGFDDGLGDSFDPVTASRVTLPSR